MHKRWRRASERVRPARERERVELWGWMRFIWQARRAPPTAASHTSICAPPDVIASRVLGSHQNIPHAWSLLLNWESVLSALAARPDELSPTRNLCAFLKKFSPQVYAVIVGIWRCGVSPILSLSLDDYNNCRLSSSLITFCEIQDINSSLSKVNISIFCPIL